MSERSGKTLQPSVEKGRNGPSDAHAERTTAKRRSVAESVSVQERQGIGISPSSSLPTLGALQRAAPFSHPPLGVVALHLRFEAFGNFPLLRDFLAALPHANGQARQIRRAERGGLENPRAHHGDAEQVRLELHQQIV